MKSDRLRYRYSHNELGEVIALSIVSIDKDLKYTTKNYEFKPREGVDPNSTKVHGYDNEYFEKNPGKHKHFNKKVAKEIHKYLE